MSSQIKEEIVNILKDIEGIVNNIYVYKDGGALIARRLNEIRNELNFAVIMNVKIYFVGGERIDITGISVDRWKSIKSCFEKEKGFLSFDYYDAKGKVFTGNLD